MFSFDKSSQRWCIYQCPLKKVRHLIHVCHTGSSHSSACTCPLSRLAGAVAYCSGMWLLCRCHMCECVRSWPCQQTHETRLTLYHTVQRNHTFLTVSKNWVGMRQRTILHPGPFLGTDFVEFHKHCTSGWNWQSMAGPWTRSQKEANKLVPSAALVTASGKWSESCESKPNTFLSAHLAPMLSLAKFVHMTHSHAKLLKKI